MQEQAVKTTTMTRSEFTKGQYLPLGRIAHLEGGGRLGWRNACKLFAKCMMMGPPWIMYDPLTEALRALYIIMVQHSGGP